MLPINNPFTSETYQRHWMNQFFPQESCHTFEAVQGVAFTAHRKLPLYVNVGMYKTHGISYTLEDPDRGFSLKNRALLIYDVPEYFKLPEAKVPYLGVKKSAQYRGYAVDLTKLRSLDEYLNEQFSSKGRKSILSRLAKLEREFNIEYRFYYGEIGRAEFESLLECLYGFITQAFEGKSSQNSHAPQEIRAWYKEMLFDMINESRASFFVIYGNGRPIAISVNYHAENIMFASIPSYNLEYRQFGIGNIANLKKIEWAIARDYKVFDLSKASYGYKQRWANLEYNFEYHVLFDKRNLKSLLNGYAVFLYYQLKQKLRQAYHRFRQAR